jgi:predicted transcriptional regulator
MILDRVDCEGLTTTGGREVVGHANLIDATGAIVMAYVSRHNVPREDLASIIGIVANALGTAEIVPQEAATGRPVPRIPIPKTITRDTLISLEDGRAYRTLKKHLSLRGLTPEAYREKWGLPSNYPMVSPGYAAMRSALAKQAGLGQKRGSPVPEPKPPAKRGRPRKKIAE